MLEKVKGVVDEVKVTTDQLLKGLRAVYSLLMNPVEHRSASVDFYSDKGGQLQFRISPPVWRPVEGKDGESYRVPERSGAVFIEAAPPLPGGPTKKLDWQNKKIIMALADKDIADLVYAIDSGLQTPLAIIHTTESKEGPVTKKLSLSPGKEYNGVMNYQMELKVSQGNKEVSKVFKFMSPSDLTRLQLLLRTSFPIILGNIR